MIISKETQEKFRFVEKIVASLPPEQKADIENPDYKGHPYLQDPRDDKDSTHTPSRRCFAFPEAIFEQILLTCIAEDFDTVNKYIVMLEPNERIEFFEWLFSRARDKAGYDDIDVRFALLYCVNFLQKFLLARLESRQS